MPIPSFRDILWERNVDLTQKDGRDKAQRIFDRQVAGLREIKDTVGFQMILEWLEAEESIALETVAQSEKPRIIEKARYKVCRDMLSFINSRLSTSS